MSGMGGFTMRFLALLAALPVLAGSPAARAQAPAPAPVAIPDPIPLQLRATAFHYRGVVTGADGPARLLLGLDAPGGGMLTGYAVLLSAGGAVEAGGPVSGGISAPDCRFRVTLGPARAELSGTCGPDLVQGSLRERFPRTGLARLAWPDGGVATGRAWLQRDDAPFP